MVKARPRNGFLLAIIAIFLGVPSAMLWLGRWKTALIYLILYVAVLTLFAIPSWFGLRAAIEAAWLAPEYANFAFLAIGLGHCLWIRATALDRPWYSRWYVACTAIAVPALLTAFAVRTFLYQPFSIPSDSNHPNLVVGDYVFVSKTAYGYSKFSFPWQLVQFSGRTKGSLPHRGDLVVFKHPQHPGIDYVKRVIGLPGERIQLKQGIVYINSVALQQNAVQLDAVYYEGHEGVSYFTETTPEGRSYVVANMTDEGEADTTGIYEVPAGEYFVLGDNRDNSADSRFQSLGMIPTENFIGPVVARFFNLNGVPLNNRPLETWSKP